MRRGKKDVYEKVSFQIQQLATKKISLAYRLHLLIIRLYICIVLTRRLGYLKSQFEFRTKVRKKELVNGT